MGFSKLHSSLVYSSLWNEPDHVRLLFITLLAMADKNGCVYGSRAGLIRAAMLDLNDCRELDPWSVLMSPDPDSSDKLRAPENDGRRLEEVEGGFRLLNYTYYRSLRDEDDRARQNREAQARFRAKNGGKSKRSSATVSHGQPRSAQAEAEAEAEASETRSTSSPLSPQSDPSGPPLASPPPSATAAGDPAGALKPRSKKKTDPVDSRPWPAPTAELQEFPRWWTPDVAPLHRTAQRRFVEEFDGFMETVDKAYPLVDLLAELRKAYAWEEARGAKTPKGRKAFIRNWIERAAGAYSKPATQAPYSQAVPR